MENVFFLIVSKCFSSGLHDFEMLFQWTTTINNFNKNRYISISWFDIRFLLYQRKNSRICVNDSRQLCSLSAGLLSVNQTIKRFSWRSWICHGRHFDTDSFFSFFWTQTPNWEMRDNAWMEKIEQENANNDNNNIWMNRVKCSHYCPHRFRSLLIAKSWNGRPDAAIAIFNWW